MKIQRLTVHCWVASLLAAALSIAGCSGEGTADTVGSIGVNIDLGGTDSTETFNEVQWEITTDPGGAVVDNGAINTSQPGTADDDQHSTTAFFEKFGLLPGDYIVTLSTTSTDGDTFCTGSAPFSITSDVRTDVFVRLNCQSEERLGAVRVTGDFNRCAELTMVVVSPLQVSVGFDIDVFATADDDEGDSINFVWEATGGTIDDPAAGSGSDPAESTTFYTCEASGFQTITARVTDDFFMFCEDSWTVEVECAPAALCGNGDIDPGEDCDPPNGVTCDADCQRIPTCGDSILDPGEDCDPPDGVFCDAACQDIDPCAVPGICDDTDNCTADACSANPVDNTAVCDYTPEPDGTACDDFLPNSGVCIAGGCVEVPASVSQVVGIVASNNVTGDISELPYELSVTALGPVVDGVPVDFAVTGVAFFPPVFLNAAIATIPGLTEVTLNALTATPHIRSGALGAPYDLVELTSAAPLPSTETIPILGLPASTAICGPLNLSTCPNTCTDGTPCSQGSTTCDFIGDGTCEPRGACICVVEPLVLPLSSDVVTVTPDIAATGDILFGWNEDLLPPQTVIATNPPGPNGIRVLAIVLNVGIEGWMGKLTSVPPDPDVAGPLLDSELLPIPISP